MKISPRRILIGAAVLSLPVLLLLFVPTARAAKLIAPTWFGMEEMAPRIYVEKEMPAGQRQQLAGIVADSARQMTRHYGGVVSAPKLFFCSSDTRFRALGGTNQTALSFGRFAALFPPRRASTPIVAHEWSHAELHARLGGWRRWRLPRWFDEGLAVAVSEEPRHSETVYRTAVESGAQIPDLSELESLRQWSRAVGKYRDPKLNPKNLAVVYSTAGHEVRPWLDQVGSTGLNDFIHAVRTGAPFERAYAAPREKAAAPIIQPERAGEKTVD